MNTYDNSFMNIYGNLWQQLKFNCPRTKKRGGMEVEVTVIRNMIFYDLKVELNKKRMRLTFTVSI